MVRTALFEWFDPGVTDQGDARLRTAARAWLAALDRVDAAMAGDDHDDYGATLELAEAATLARLGLQQALVDLGWSPPRSVREAQNS